MFQFALPRGERLLFQKALDCCRCFNSRSREGSDLQPDYSASTTKGFNSRSREGSDLNLVVKCCQIHCFNSRSREGSDDAPFLRGKAWGVSIRAPARGATATSTTCLSFAQSHFALPRGDRLMYISKIVKVFDVSIRAPARGATSSYNKDVFFFLVSIRAPARGATASGGFPQTRIVGFNSRSREGSDLSQPPRLARYPRFNSRSREGSDELLITLLHKVLSFNSRSREGSDGLFCDCIR